MRILYAANVALEVETAGVAQNQYVAALKDRWRYVAAHSDKFIEPDPGVADKVVVTVRFPLAIGQLADYYALLLKHAHRDFFPLAARTKVIERMSPPANASFCFGAATIGYWFKYVPHLV